MKTLAGNLTAKACALSGKSWEVGPLLKKRAFPDWQSAGTGLTCVEYLPSVFCSLIQFFFNTDQLIIFCQSVRARQRPCFDLTAIRGNRKIGDCGIFCFT